MRRIAPNMNLSHRYYFAWYFYGFQNSVAVGGA